MCGKSLSLVYLSRRNSTSLAARLKPKHSTNTFLHLIKAPPNVYPCRSVRILACTSENKYEFLFPCDASAIVPQWLNYSSHTPKSHYWLSWKKTDRSERTALHVLMVPGRFNLYTSGGDKPKRILYFDIKMDKLYLTFFVPDCALQTA